MADNSNSGKIISGIDAGLDLGVIASLLFSFLGLGKTSWGKNISSLFTSLGQSPAMKQKFGKWFGVGLEDEGELWKVTLALLGKTENGLKKVTAVNFLLAAMKNDMERNMFRAIIIKISAGASESTGNVLGADGKTTIMKSALSKLDAENDLRVIALDTLATLILGDKPSQAFIVKIKQQDGTFLLTPTPKEKERIALALDIIRNQGLGKDSEPVRIARAMWNNHVKSYFNQLSGEIAKYFGVASLNDVTAEMMSSRFHELVNPVVTKKTSVGVFGYVIGRLSGTPNIKI